MEVQEEMTQIGLEESGPNPRIAIYCIGLLNNNKTRT